MTNTIQYLTNSPDQTIRIGKKLAQTLCPGDIVALHGELGAGKTTLVKGIAEGLGVKEDIVSPTFTLMNVYPVTSYELRVTKLVHIDTYRLKTERELVDIGVEDYLGEPDTICVIEWPEKLTFLLRNRKLIDIELKHTGDKERNIMIRDTNCLIV